MSFLLPSGRSLTLHEPTIGEALDLTMGDWENAKLLLLAKVALIAPELAEGEFEAIPMKAGLALIKEVSRIWDGDPEPVKKKSSRNGSSTRSTASIPKAVLTPTPS